jgi:hypothetical protein
LQGKDPILFELLKQKIVAVMQQSYPGINPVIAEWKGQEITDFQEDLHIRANANLSEKWFYTHMKSPASTIPRIDMLNILSKYAGYTNWDEFVFQNGQKILIPAFPAKENKRTAGANRYFLVIPLVTAAVVAILFWLFTLFNTREYRFTFIDADTHEPLTSPQTEVILLPGNESPVHSMVDSSGVYRLTTGQSRIRMVVRSPYYQTDTITRIVRKLGNDEVIALKADDYALMIHYISTRNSGDWEHRRKRLGEMIADEAVIVQLIRDDDTRGMTLYSKQEFIDLLTMPAGSLKNIEVLGTRKKEDKIVLLRFRINDTEK